MPSACACTDCVLHETAITVCMAPDTPNDKPTFAVVGEAPGAEEDRQGLPFVGPSGQLLWDELARHGLTRESAHVTNVVKCRPPDNRTPKQGEIKRCLPYLQAELEYLRDMGCKYILALGATAYKALGGQGSITEHAGTPYEWQGFTIVPSLHPAAALRSPQQMARFKQAVGRFAQVVRGKE